MFLETATEAHKGSLKLQKKSLSEALHCVRRHQPERRVICEDVRSSNVMDYIPLQLVKGENFRQGKENKVFGCIVIV